MRTRIFAYGCSGRAASSGPGASVGVPAQLFVNGQARDLGEVRGLAERQVMANEVTWPITFNIAGDDLTTIYDNVSRTDSIIVRFLTSSGITRDEISVAPPSTYNAAANQYAAA